MQQKTYSQINLFDTPADPPEQPAVGVRIKSLKTTSVLMPEKQAAPEKPAPAAPVAATTAKEVEAKYGVRVKQKITATPKENLSAQPDLFGTPVTLPPAPAKIIIADQPVPTAAQPVNKSEPAMLVPRPAAPENAQEPRQSVPAEQPASQVTEPAEPRQPDVTAEPSVPVEEALIDPRLATEEPKPTARVVAVRPSTAHVVLPNTTIAKKSDNPLVHKLVVPRIIEEQPKAAVQPATLRPPAAHIVLPDTTAAAIEDSKPAEALTDPRLEQEPKAQSQEEQAIKEHVPEKPAQPAIVAEMLPAQERSVGAAALHELGNGEEEILDEPMAEEWETSPKDQLAMAQPEPVLAEAPESAVRPGNRLPEKKSTRGRKSLKALDAEIDNVNIPPDETLFQRQYYSIGEVATMFGVNQSLLRFWENEFDIIQPRKNRKGDRHFRPVDIRNLELIHDLLRRRKLTIEGAKDFLKKNKQAREQFTMIQSLQDIRSFLLEIKASLG